MTTIKPGMLCVVHGSGNVDEPNVRGRIVETLFYMGRHDYICPIDGEHCRIDRAWCVTDREGSYAVDERHLRPIHDPDADLADQNDCMDMNLLAVLPLAREAV